MADDYTLKRKAADRYIPAQADILRRNALKFISFKISSEREDCEEATDFVINVEGGQVALRVREPSCKFRDFTIRSRSKYGMKTELDKLREGFAHWYLYCWGDGSEGINEYILVDMNTVREHGLLDLPRREMSNYDGTKFIAIGTDELQMCGAIIDLQLNGTIR